MRVDARPIVVERHDSPAEVRALTTLRKVDYTDLFTVSAPGARERTAEEWGRIALEGASPSGRFIAWQVLCGLRLDTEPSPNRVAGWRIAGKGDDWLRLEAASWFMTVHAVVHVEDEQVSIGLFIHYDRAAGGLIWPPLSVVHRRLMPGLLRGAVIRMSRKR